MAQVAEAMPVGHGKGRQMNIEDVKQRLPKGPDGKAPSDWYVRRVMADVGQFRIGKWNFVHETDLERWLAQQGSAD
jgi:hypothetical protein